MMIISNVKVLLTKYPLCRGMLTYSIIWPTSALVQQMIAGKKWGTFDWSRCIRFSIYGSLFVAPTLYSWVKISSMMWPKTCLRTGLIKAVVEQFTYTPAAMICFYFLMSLMENKTLTEAKHEVAAKFWPTYKVAMCVWPIIATVNFTLVPERNRVPVISVCSLVWTCFLAYMKQLEHDHEHLQ